MMFNLSRNSYFIRHQHILVQNKVNACTKLWLANRASQNMALAGPRAVCVASGHREARPLHLQSMSFKYSIFVDELMIRIIFVVDILREYADSRKFWRQCNLVH